MQNINFKPYFFLLLELLLIGSLLSCAHTNSLTGTWQEPGKKSTIEFHADGTFNAVDDMEMAVRGKYTLQKNGSIRFEITHEGAAPEIVEGRLSERGAELTFSSADGKKAEIYQRVK
jgi:hypothetical protein